MKRLSAFFLVAISMTAAARPSLEEVRNDMGIRSSDEVRGQRDAVGYATKADAMAKVWELSAQGPMPESFGARLEPGVIGVIGPHDDYIYAARTYREIFPLVTAKTVASSASSIATAAEARDRSCSVPTARGARRMAFPRCDELIAQLPAGMAVKDAAAHDSEHSIEGIAYFLKHARRDVEIVPVIVPAASFQRLNELASKLSSALAASMQRRDWQLGRDVAIVISADGTHYGEDFKFTPYGWGGVKAYSKTVEQDRKIMRDTLGGMITAEKARAFYPPSSIPPIRISTGARGAAVFRSLSGRY
jgi:AmmeMemoRadiSam system protein B